MVQPIIVVLFYVIYIIIIHTYIEYMIINICIYIPLSMRFLFFYLTGYLLLNNTLSLLTYGIWYISIYYTML